MGDFQGCCSWISEGSVSGVLFEVLVEVRVALSFLMPLGSDITKRRVIGGAGVKEEVVVLAWTYLMLAGAAAGTLAGLFGVGGGMVVVPVLLFLLPKLGVTEQWLVHIAVGTSLATIVFTGASSVWRHHRLGAVQWPLVKGLVPGLVVGALVGSVLTPLVPGAMLQWVIGAMILMASIKMLFNWQPPAHWAMPDPIARSFVSAGIGGLSALCGIGGGSLIVPFLTACRVQMHQAVAASAACGVPIAGFGVVGYVLAGGSVPDLPRYCIGYVYWPAVLMIVVPSMLFAQWGAKLAHRLPVKPLKRCFGVFMVLIGLRLIL